MFGAAGSAGVRWARLRGPEEELRAIGQALPRTDAERRAPLLDRVVELARIDPDHVAAEVATWPAELLPVRVRDGLVAAWVHAANPHRFAATWTALAGVRPVGGGARDPEIALVGAVRAQLSATRPSAGFGLGALAFLEARLPDPERGAADLDRDLDLLAQVLPSRHAARVGLWQLILGDTAALAGDAEQARARWRLAVDAGVVAARPRLAHDSAERGRALLRAGDAAAAAESYAEAYRLTSDLDHRRGELIARVVGAATGGGVDGAVDEDRAALAAELERLVPGDPDAALWAGLAHVVAGDPGAGAPLLRRAEHRVAEPRREDVARLVRMAELDDDGLRALGRSLLDEHGGGWAEHGPVPPERILGAAADPAHPDPELLTGLVTGLLDGGPAAARLTAATRARAAHAVVDAALRGPADGVLPGIALAERLLAEDA